MAPGARARDYRVKGAPDTTPPLGRAGRRGYTSGRMSDAELLRRIVQALAVGRAEIAFSGGLQSHMDFPGNSETDKVPFILGSVALVALAYWRGDWWLVGAALALVAAGYWLFWRRLVQRRMRRRFIAQAMGDPRLWRKSWGFAGIALRARGEECRSPGGDWRAFAARLDEGEDG